MSIPKGLPGGTTLNVTAEELDEWKEDHGYLFGGDMGPDEKVCPTCNEDWPCTIRRLIDDLIEIRGLVKE